MPYARYETWFAVVVLVCRDSIISELQSYSRGGMKELIFGLCEGTKSCQPHVCGLIVVFNC